ncbi:hypothetical protein QBZ16_004466 [Prototheca wickerhamii]|uniref:General transcription factor 3C polypeptide 3 n=1 Tax=Prototheca wickerhamii TaxID=3111 RepID=A0AAD9IHC3_PROWI|nr:hypothetical protein QBZ16_004466 [Prototheca wickerhamii]
MSGDEEDEYVPILGEDDYSGEDGSAMEEDAEVDAFAGAAMDEEDYLRGFTTGGETEEEDDEPPALFEDAFGPESLLAGLEARPDGAQGQEAFDLLARRGRRRRQPRRASARQDRSPGGAAPDPDEAVVGTPAARLWRERGRHLAGRRAGGPRGRKRRVSEEAAALMAEATMLYVNNERHVEAIGKLMEVIRCEPNMPDPYHLLGVLHEAVGNQKKALDFFMIAAHLTPKDLALWRRLAGLSSEQGLLRQAAYCLTQVLRRDRGDAAARFDRALIFADLGDSRRALHGLAQVAAAAPEHPEVPKARARLLFRLGRADEAIEALTSFMEARPEHVDATHLNILAELFAQQERWPDVIRLLDRAEADARELVGSSNEDASASAPSTSTPPLLPADLRVKRGLAHLAAGDVPAALAGLESLLPEPVDAFADLFLEVGERLMRAGLPGAALPFLQPVAEGGPAGGIERAALAALLADCHEALGDARGALGALRGAVEALEPTHPALAGLALRAAEDEPQRVLLRRAALLHAAGRTEPFLDLALPTLGATLRALEAEAERIAPDPALRRRLRWLGRRRAARRGAGPAAPDADMFGASAGRGDRRKAHIRLLDERAEELVAAVAQDLSEEEGGAGPGAGPAPALVVRELLTEDGPFALLIQAGQALLDEGRAEEARELAAAATDVCGKRWAQRWKREAVRLLAARAALALGDAAGALQGARAAGQRWPLAAAAWNTYARCATLAGRARQALRHLLPQRHRSPASVPLALLVGHCHLGTGAWQEAVSEYCHALRAGPAEPLVPLCVAAALLGQAGARGAGAGAERDQLVLRAFAFLDRYASLRKNEQESLYNLGRAAQQSGALHVAVAYYKRALECPPVADDLADDLSREAAHNLALIYRASGSHALARQVAETYLAI